eukprot:9413637-Alexandrium_andersonii.AAC.1
MLPSHAPVPVANDGHAISPDPLAGSERPYLAIPIHLPIFLHVVEEPHLHLTGLALEHASTVLAEL